MTTTISRVRTVIHRLKNNKTLGVNSIPPKFFKNATKSFVKDLTSTTYTIFENCVAPDSFRKALLYPIFKKRNPREAANNRSTLFLNVKSTVFRKVYSTVDRIFILTSTTNESLLKKKSSTHSLETLKLPLTQLTDAAFS